MVKEVSHFKETMNHFFNNRILSKASVLCASRKKKLKYNVILKPMDRSFLLESKLTFLL